MFRVIVAGGRDFTDYALLSKTMDEYLSVITDDIAIVCGKACGADTLGEQYGKTMVILFTIFLLIGSDTVRLPAIFATRKWRRTRMLSWRSGTAGVLAQNT